MADAARVQADRRQSGRAATARRLLGPHLFGVLCVMQIAFWCRVLLVPISFRYPQIFLFLFLGRLSLIFGSALFGIVVFRHAPELNAGIDLLLMAKRGMILIGSVCAVLHQPRGRAAGASV